MTGCGVEETLRTPRGMPASLCGGRWPEIVAAAQTLAQGGDGTRAQEGTEERRGRPAAGAEGRGERACAEDGRRRCTGGTAVARVIRV
jgi:hypothetical protein